MTAHVQRIAHRGGANLAPENTLAAFRNALTFPIDAIELDVQMSHDGHAIVFHDDTVDRLTNGAGNILDLDFAYLRSLNAAAHFPGGWPERAQIPTLREVLALAKGRVQVYIEMKSSKRDGVYGRYPGIVEAVIEEVRAASMLKHVLIISFDWSALSSIKVQEPALRLGALVAKDVWNLHNEGVLDTLISQVTAVGADWMNIDRELVTPAILRVIHSKSFKLGAWTIDELDELRYLASMGVDSLTSNRPDLFDQL